MKIYLDINGVIERENKISKGLKPFLLKIIDKHQVYFLTTHCNGDITPTIKYLKTFTDDKELVQAFEKILPTSWEFIKPQGIDYESDFVWYDDKPLSVTEEEHMGPSVGSFILVSLVENPDFWEEEMRWY
jgi:hypothetical protein